ncbi:MAG: penicillin-binding protein 2 [Actinomycetota bacterium]|jgi:penicillin-binding protein 2|nr:penicillin-binding protein 2 [Actinomycetota bacterium]
MSGAGRRAMSQRSGLRLLVLQVLVMSLLVTLVGRLWYLQVDTRENYVRAAAENRTREIVTPAARGMILDSRGRPLARNRTALVVSISRTEMLRQRDGGRALVAKVAAVIGKPYLEVWEKTRLCGTPGASPPPKCWNGSPYQPIPVTDEADTAMALQIMERREDFPGVTAELTAVREYPMPQKANAAHILGYLGPVTDEELAAREASSAAKNGHNETVLLRTDLVGRTGLERQYDADLRGVPGVKTLAVDHRGGVSAVLAETQPTAGNHLVTTIDAKLQAVAEAELLAAIKRARTTGDPNKGGRKYKADSGAVVVMDVHTGGIVAMASWPTYNPNIWVGGISIKDYQAIASAKNNFPNQSRATQGEFAPASTFKAVSLPAAVKAGYSVHASYPCPSGYPIGGTLKSNYESQGYGTISMERAIEVSCDTVFYKFAYETWLRMGKLHPKAGVKDPFTEMAKGYGLGKPTGIDLPSESSGRIADRAWKQAYWKETRDFYCRKAKSGYPDVAKRDPDRATYLRRLSRENCVDGWAYRGGDAANFAIGQGDTTVTPLQMARVYSAVANGGILVTPHIGKAIITPQGQLVRRLEPKATGRVPADRQTLAWLRNAMRQVSVKGTGAGPFRRASFPLAKLPVASKTGTGEVYGKQTTSWFASFAPSTKPQYAVVMMVSQGGTGSGTSGPAVAQIYKTLFGINGQTVDLAKATPPGGHPTVALPVVRSDGTVVQPDRPVRGQADIIPPFRREDGG